MSEDKETKKINELKNRLKDDVDSDLFENEYMFYRFLKYHDFDVDAAEKMLRKHLEFRKKFDLKNIFKIKQKEVFEKYMPNIKLGYDKQGCVVRFVPIGNIDWIGIIDSTKHDDLIKHLIYLEELNLSDIREQYRKFGRKAGKITFIYNFENMSFKQATDKRVISNIVYWLNMFTINYPEVLKSVIFINASLYFEIFYSVLKTFIPSVIVDKIHVYSDDTFKEDFLKEIDADVLPAFLGGNRTDPDGNPLCLSFVNHGNPVPEEYYIHRSKRSLAMLPDAKKITVSNSSFHEVFVLVKETESYLEWEFETEFNDIGFGLLYRDIAGKRTEIIPVQRINTDDYSETGVYKCDSAGTYIILFDNTYSYVRSKTIYYKIKVLTPKEKTTFLMNEESVVAH